MKKCPCDSIYYNIKGYFCDKCGAEWDIVWRKVIKKTKKPKKSARVEEFAS